MQNIYALSIYVRKIETPLYLSENFYLTNLHDIEDIESVENLLHKFCLDSVSLETNLPGLKKLVLKLIDQSDNKVEVKYSNDGNIDVVGTVARNIVVLVNGNFDNDLYLKCKDIWMTRSILDTPQEEYSETIHEFSREKFTWLFEIRSFIKQLKFQAFLNSREKRLACYSKSYFYSQYNYSYLNNGVSSVNFINEILENLDQITSNSKDDTTFIPYEIFVEEIVSEHEKIRGMSSTNWKVFEYMADQFEIISETDNHGIRLVSIMSLLEMMTTQKTKPSEQTFNSITMQLKRNISLIMWLNDTKNDPVRTRKIIGILYDIRSHIAHGNYIGIDELYSKFMQILLDDSLESIDDLRGSGDYLAESVLTDYFRVVSRFFIERSEYLAIINFLK